MMIRIDKSKLMLFLSDKKLFKKTYIDKIEITPNIYIARGSFIHKILEDELKKIRLAWSLAKNKKDYIASTTNYIAKRYIIHKNGKGFTNKAIANAYAFLLSFFHKYPFYPISIEDKYIYRDNDNNVVFVGKPDAIVRLLDDNKVVLWDFKVSNFRDRVYKTISGFNASSFEINYYMWLMNKLNKKVDGGAIIPLVSSKPRLLSISPQLEVFEGIVYKVIKDLREFLKSYNFPEDEL